MLVARHSKLRLLSSHTTSLFSQATFKRKNSWFNKRLTTYARLRTQSDLYSEKVVKERAISTNDEMRNRYFKHSWAVQSCRSNVIVETYLWQRLFVLKNLSQTVVRVLVCQTEPDRRSFLRSLFWALIDFRVGSWVPGRLLSCL